MGRGAHAHEPGHGHGHLGGDPPAVVRGRRALVAAVVVIALATLAGLVALWPSEPVPTRPGAGDRVDGRVLTSSEVPCNAALPDAPPTESEHDVGEDRSGAVCVDLVVRVEEGPDAGRTFTTVTGDRHLEGGTDVVLLGGGADVPFDARYEIADAKRGLPLAAVAGLFLVVLLVVGRVRGLLAVAGAAASLGVLVVFLVPALLTGRPPVLTAVVGASAVMLVVLLLAHGPSVRTATALVGTAVALLVTTALGTWFTDLAALTGLTSDESAFVQASFGELDLRGLLLAGMVVGALGILDDVTVTQVSAVYELRRADPGMSGRELYQSALRVGRDHIASTVNTLLLAYAGAAMPLLVVFRTSGDGLLATVTNGVVAEEVVRTLVGSIGLILAVPITTALAAATCPPQRAAADA